MSKLTEMLKRHEGVRKYGYSDPMGYLTVAVGRNIDARGGLGLSDTEIEFLLRNDIDRVREELKSNFPWFHNLKKARKDAMIDICFNLGITKLLKFEKALAAMAEEDYITASNEFLDSRWAVQVGNRAMELAEMIETGEYS